MYPKNTASIWCFDTNDYFERPDSVHTFIHFQTHPICIFSEHGEHLSFRWNFFPRKNRIRTYADTLSHTPKYAHLKNTARILAVNGMDLFERTDSAHVIMHFHTHPFKLYYIYAYLQNTAVILAVNRKDSFEPEYILALQRECVFDRGVVLCFLFFVFVYVRAENVKLSMTVKNEHKAGVRVQFCECVCNFVRERTYYRVLLRKYRKLHVRHDSFIRVTLAIQGGEDSLDPLSL